MKKLEKMNEKERKAALIKAATDLQKVCGFEPAIITKGKSVEELEAILQEAKEEVTPDDKLSKMTKDVLAQLPEVKKEEVPAKEEKKGKKKKGQKVKEEKKETKVKATSKKEKAPKKDENEELKQEIADAKKMKPLKKIVKANDLFKSIRPKLSGYSSVKSLQKVLLKVLDGSLVIKDTKASKDKKDKPAYVGISKKDQVKFFNPLIKSGKHDQKTLMEKGTDEFGDTAKKSIADFLSYSKNPKYKKFDKVVVVDKKGKLRFEK